MGDERKVYTVLVGKPEGKKPLGRPRRRWENGIRIDLREIGWRVWNGFSWLRLGTGGGLCEHGDESSCSGALELVVNEILVVGCEPERPALFSEVGMRGC
jgi:hypothetical protein